MKPPRRPRRYLQFSLRTLLVLVTLAGIALGRIDYLRRCSAFHKGEFERHIEKIQAATGPSPDDANRFANCALPSSVEGWAILDSRLIPAQANDDTRAVKYHWRLAQEFSRAAYRPWIFVDETPVENEIGGVPH